MSAARTTPTASESGTGECATDVGRALMEKAIETAFEARATALMLSMFEQSMPRDECLAGAQRLLDHLAVAVNWCASAAPNPVVQTVYEDFVIDSMREMSKAVRVGIDDDAHRRDHLRAMCIAIVNDCRPHEATMQNILRVAANQYPDVSEREVRRHLDYLEAKGTVQLHQVPAGRGGALRVKLTAAGIDEAEGIR